MGRTETVIEEVEEMSEPQSEEQNVAIQVVDLHKHYRKYHRSEVVLNGLNLNCQAGKLLVPNCNCLKQSI